MIILNQKAWLGPYIDMYTKLRKQAKNDFEKEFNLTNNTFFKKNNGELKEAQTYQT